jgi:hypothetical protein
MKRIKIIGLAIVAVFAMSVVGVASASAHEFVASKTGKLTGKALNTHVFKTKAGNVECKKATLPVSAVNEVKELKAKTQEVEVKYEECKAFGFVSAEVSNAKYLFSAETTKNASVKNTVTVKASTCTVTVEPVTANQELEKVSYANLTGGTLEVKAKVEKVTYKTSAGCTSGAGTFTDGLYEGNEEVTLEGGTLEWL